MSYVRELRDELKILRVEVSGKTFDEAPEAFKDIEGLKVMIAKAVPVSAKSARSPQTRRHVRERRQ